MALSVEDMTDTIPAIATRTPLLEQIRSSMPALTPAERRVAETVLRDPLAVIHWSITELASEAQTSAASVVRLCSTLGLRGYQELKITLATQAIPSEKRVLDAIEPGDEVDAVVAKVLTSTARAIEATVNALDTVGSAQSPTPSSVRAGCSSERSARRRRLPRTRPTG